MHQHTACPALGILGMEGAHPNGIPTRPWWRRSRNPGDSGRTLQRELREAPTLDMTLAMKSAFGFLSCGLFALSLLLFGYFWQKLGVLPVSRGGIQEADVYTSFRMLWSPIFKVLPVFGLVFGLIAVVRNGAAWAVPTAGLALNCIALLALIVLGATAG